MIKKIFLLVLLGTVSTLTVGACYLRPIPQKLLSGSSITGSTIGISSTTGRNVLCSSIVKTPPVYTNTEYGFQLTLPKRWKKYKVSVYKTPTTSGGTVSIALPTYSPWPGIEDRNDPNLYITGYTGQIKTIKGYGEMFRINIYSYKDYKDFVKMNDEMRGTGAAEYWTLGKTDKYMFVEVGPNDLPDDLKKLWYNGDVSTLKKMFGIIELK